MKKATQIMNIIEYIILPFSMLMTLMSLMAFDAPGSEKSPLAWLFFIGINAYLIVLVISLILSRKYYTQERYTLSFWISFIPVIPGIWFLLEMSGLPYLLR